MFRLFSCETSKDGDCFLVEWNETQGTIKRKYSGFRNKSEGIVKIDIAKNRFLAAGVDNQIKFWDFGGINVLTSTDAGGDLPVSIVLLLFIYIFIHFSENNLTYIVDG